MEPSAIVSSFTNTLHAQGLWAALAFLNGTTDYRFTGMFHFNGIMLENVALFDRENPGVRKAPDVEASLSYCSMMRASGQPLRFAESTKDPRVAAHPAREAVQAYCGVPLMDPNGNVLGSLCHYSEEPCLMYDEDLEVLLQLPAALAGVRWT
jgi:hypothetical protein